MATPRMDTRRLRGAEASDALAAPRRSDRAPLGPTVALTITLAVATVIVVVAAVELLVHPSGSAPTKQRA